MIHPTLPDCFGSVEHIAHGSHSSVYKAFHNVTKTWVALKVFDTRRMAHEDLATIQREVECQHNLCHPYIAQYFGTIRTRDAVILVTEYAGSQSLYTKIEEEGALLEVEAVKIFSEIVCALYYLHVEHKTAHRDIKLENIMIDEAKMVKLVDFGVSRTGISLMSSYCGSYPYCAPEIFGGQKYTQAVDVWAAGVVLFGLLTGELPFDAPHFAKLAAKICNEEPDFPTHVTPEASDVLHRTLEKNPEKRITIRELMEHPWISESSFISDITHEIINCMKSSTELPFGAAFDVNAKRIMEEMQIDVTTLESDIANGVESETTMTYRILKCVNSRSEMRNTRGIQPFKSAPPKFRLPSVSVPPKLPYCWSEVGISPQPSDKGTHMKRSMIAACSGSIKSKKILMPKVMHNTKLVSLVGGKGGSILRSGSHHQP